MRTTPLRPEGSDSTRITMRLSGVPVAEALEQLTQVSGISLVYDAAILQAVGRGGRPIGDQRVFCRVAAQPPDVLLGCIVREAGLDFYRLSSGTYVVIASAEALPGFAALSGVVIDAETRAPVAQAVVQVAERPDARVANGAGHFTFTALAPGRYRVLVRALGYVPLRAEVDLPPDGRLRERFVLRPQAIMAMPIVVNGVSAAAPSTIPGTTTFDEAAVAPLVQGPGLVVPGAPLQLGLTRRDGVGDLHLQGGEAGEHLWRLDGVPLFDAASLSGLFGSFAPLAIDRLAVHRAGFGARMGSMTAGAIDLTHGVARSTSPQLTLQVDPIAAHGRLDLPAQWRGRRWDSRISARTGLWPWYAPGALAQTLRAWNTPDPVLMQRLATPGAHDSLGARRYAIDGASIGVAVADVHAATRLDVTPFQQVDASFQASRSGVDSRTSAAVPGGAAMAGRDDYEWTGGMAQLRHHWLIGTRVTQTTQVYLSQHALTHRMAAASHASALDGAVVRWDGNRMQEVGASTVVAIGGSPDWTVELGAATARSAARLELENGVTRALRADVTQWRGVAHADVSRRLRGEVWVDAGLRATRLAGASPVWLEPRLAVRGSGEAALLGRYAWRVAGGTYRQFVNQFDVATTMPIALVPSVRFWLPADGTRGIATAQHLAAEVAVQPARGWELRVEAYAKRQPTILAFDYAALLDHGARSPAATTPLGFVGRARGEAAGVGARVVREATVRGTMPVRIELGYDAGVARRTFPSRFNDALQPAPWMEPHRGLFALELRPTPAWHVGARARGVWGRPWGLRQAYYDLLSVHSLGAGLPIGDPSAIRRPALIDTDLGVSWTRPIGRWRTEIGGAVQNLLDRANVLDFALRQHSATTPGVYERDARLLPGRQFLLSMRVSR
ncbi:MAG: carboxypeptidase-like regulatory domain-containing protein [Gemmatimonadaceae bacterium]|nr:carboxypeptidase-like regulatory domain-containing protein [Gemmatimonadaceae bacterium]